MWKEWLILAILPIIWSTCVGDVELTENWEKHHTNSEVKEIMDAVHMKCPDRTRVYNLPDPPYDGVPDKTAYGQKLWVIEFAVNTGKHTPGVPEFKYIGNMHGNEVVGKEILLRLIVLMCDVLNDDVGNDLDTSSWNIEDIRWLLDNTHIHIMPSMNPDGWLKSYSEGKVGKPCEGDDNPWLRGRANGNCVDLNRNFPDLDIEYYQDKKGPNNHLEKLKTLFRENKNAKIPLQPETKMVMAWIFSVPWVLSANMHGGDLVANYAFDESRPRWPNQASPTPDDALFKTLASSYADAHTKMADKNHKKCDINGDFPDGTTNGAEWYSVANGMQDFNYLGSNCFEITLELGCTKFPKASELNSYWEDNVNALFNFIYQSHLGIKGKISVNNEDKNTPVVIKAYTWDENKGDEVYINHDITSNPGYGDYFRLLNTGKYTIRAVLHRPEGDIVRIKCVNVMNTDTTWKEAKEVDFDFRNDANMPVVYEDGKSCKEEHDEKMGQLLDDRMEAPLDQEYYNDDLYTFLRRIWNRNRNMY